MKYAFLAATMLILGFFMFYPAEIKGQNNDTALHVYAAFLSPNAQAYASMTRKPVFTPSTIVYFSGLPGVRYSIELVGRDAAGAKLVQVGDVIVPVDHIPSQTDWSIQFAHNTNWVKLESVSVDKVVVVRAGTSNLIIQ